MPVVWPVLEETRERIKKKTEAKLMEDYSISEKSAQVLREIKWSNGMTGAEIAKELDMQPRSVSGVVNGLVKKGLVTKDAKGVLVFSKSEENV